MHLCWLGKPTPQADTRKGQPIRDGVAKLSRDCAVTVGLSPTVVLYGCQARGWACLVNANVNLRERNQVDEWKNRDQLGAAKEGCVTSLLSQVSTTKQINKYKYNRLQTVYQPVLRALVLISFIQSPFHKVVNLSILACERLNLSMMLLSYPVMILSPVNNEAVYLWKFPDRCFWSKTFTLCCCSCLKCVAASNSE